MGVGSIVVVYLTVSRGVGCLCCVFRARAALFGKVSQ